MTTHASGKRLAMRRWIIRLFSTGWTAGGTHHEPTLRVYAHHSPITSVPNGPDRPHRTHTRVYTSS